MFGLEGSGFIISISLTFLLVGLVVYLMKRQMRGLEQKFCSIFQLSQNLATSIQHIKTSQQDRRKEVHVDNYSESENDTDDEDSDEECSGGICPINKMFESIKVIDINDKQDKPFNFENNALEQLLNPSCIEEINDCEDERDEDEDEDDQEEEAEDEDEEDEDEDDDEEDEDDDEAINNEVKKDDNDVKKETKELGVKAEVNDIHTNKPIRPDKHPDYHKLKVPELRDLIVQQNILSEKEVKTIKKLELVDLLKKNN